MNEQRVIDVSLYDKGRVLTIGSVFSIRNQSFDVRELTCNLYAITSISVFSWLHDPYVTDFRVSQFDIFDLLVIINQPLLLIKSLLILVILTQLHALTVFVALSFAPTSGQFLFFARYLRCFLSRLFPENHRHLPFALLSLPLLCAFKANLTDTLFNGNLAILNILFSLCSDVVIESLEPLEVLLSILGRLNQKGERKDVERVKTRSIIVISHIQEDTLLVRQLLVLLHAIVKFEAPILDRILQTLIIIATTFLHLSKCRFASILCGEGNTLVHYMAADSRREEGSTTQVIDMLLLLPRGPHESHFREIFIVTLLPPRSGLENLLDYFKVVTPAHIEPLKLHSGV